MKTFLALTALMMTASGCGGWYQHGDPTKVPAGYQPAGSYCDPISSQNGYVTVRCDDGNGKTLMIYDKDGKLVNSCTAMSYGQAYCPN